MTKSTSTDPIKMPKGLIHFYLIQILSKIAFSIFAPLTAVYVIALGGSVLNLGELLALFGVLNSVASYLIAKTGDKFKYISLPVSAGLFVIYSLTLFLINSVDEFYFAICFGGFASAMIRPSRRGIPLDFIDHKLYIIFEQKKVMFLSMVGAASAYLGAKIIHHSGNSAPHESQDITTFKYIFMISLIINSIVFIYSLVFFRKYNRS